MKLKILILFLLFSHFAFSQTKIDNNISINFPSQPQVINIETTDSVSVSANAFFLNNAEDSFLVIRMAHLVNGKESTALAESEKVLNDIIYKNIINGQISGMGKRRFTFKDSLRVKWNDYIGYKLLYIDPKSGVQNAESLLLFLNGISYVITYSKVDSYSQINKDKFFNSLKINKSVTVKQIEDSESSSTFYKLYTTLISLGLVLGCIWWLRKNKNKSQLGAI